MSESLLKKSFQEKDIQRARNIIAGKYGNSTQTVVGFSRTEDIHEEGDVWEQDGKTWTIEDGVRVSVSKLSRARKLHQIPLVCPKCGKPMTSRLDKKFYPLHGICYDCLVRFEDDLKRAGLYKDYEKALLKNNIKAFTEELKQRLEDMKNDLDVKLVTENGEVENWGHISNRLIEDVSEWASILEERMKD